MKSYFQSHPEMAERLLEVATRLYTSYTPGHCRDMKDILTDIEKASRPPEIRWCVSHNLEAEKLAPYCAARCTRPNCRCESVGPCDIRTYVPKEKE